MEKIKIGDILLYSFKLEDGWNKKDLYKKILEKNNQVLSEDKSGKKIKNNFFRAYDKFFIKIYGHYDKSILQNLHKCYSCPYNDEYRKFDDYNELRDEQETVLVLSSKYSDFRDYRIYCAYFSDKLEGESDNIFVYGKCESYFKKLLKILNLN